ncbi:MAG: efflux RND transporter periplasmic adaptor subunit [Desulfamplus sp.]|nr:efflux RND transporter periplasmic adaptor subunit [Desulfamplus sp.]
MENSKKSHWFTTLIRLILSLTIIAAAGLFAKHLYDTKPVAKRIKPAILPPLVETIAVKADDHAVVISAMGKVIASQTISLKARVSGFVVETSPEFIEGGIYRKGDVMLQLDPNDFTLTIKQQEAMLAKAEASLKLEMGKQEVARAELRLMQNRSSRPISEPNLALRLPQLEQIKADIASIKVDIERARLNLERTTVKAPFNCIVIATNVQIGSHISSQEPLATISGIDEYRVEATLAVDQLKWIEFPNNSTINNNSSSKKSTTTRGSDVTITTKDGTKHQGEVVRLLGNLSDKSRLARILIRIQDPLLLNPKDRSKLNSTTPLLIDSYVQADIQGKTIEGIFSLPRAAVRDGDKIWVVNNEMALEIIDIDLIWKDNESVYIKHGLQDGDNIVISELSSPVHGMSVKIYNK